LRASPLLPYWAPEWLDHPFDVQTIAGVEDGATKAGGPEATQAEALTHCMEPSETDWLATVTCEAATDQVEPPFVLVKMSSNRLFVVL
jgi:hypothetical protein